MGHIRYMLIYEHSARLLDLVVVAGAEDRRHKRLQGQASALSQSLGLVLVSPYSTYLHSVQHPAIVALWSCSNCKDAQYQYFTKKIKLMMIALSLLWHNPPDSLHSFCQIKTHFMWVCPPCLVWNMARPAYTAPSCVVSYAAPQQYHHFSPQTYACSPLFATSMQSSTSGCELQ